MDICIINVYMKAELWINFMYWRIVFKLRDAREKTPSYNYSPSSALEHPKQQPCHYATALSLSSTPLPSRQSRARTVAPSTPSPWRQTTFLSRWVITPDYVSYNYLQASCLIPYISLLKPDQQQLQQILLCQEQIYVDTMYSRFI